MKYAPFFMNTMKNARPNVKAQMSKVDNLNLAGLVNSTSFFEIV
jgi:hypothetical protein